MQFTILLVLASALLCHGQTFFSWHVLDQPYKINDRSEVVLHYRVRTRGEVDVLDQMRAGPIVRFKATPKWTVYTGYYFQPGQPLDDLWIKGHRIFSGVETTRSASRTLTWTGRVAIERHIGTGRADYNRYRSYFRAVIGHGPVTPYLQTEILAVRHGFHSSRNGGGLRFRLSPRLGAEAGFLYDNRQAEWGDDRAAVVTGLRYQWGD